MRVRMLRDALVGGLLATALAGCTQPPEATEPVAQAGSSSAAERETLRRPPSPGPLRSGQPITLPTPVAPASAGTPISQKSLALRTETVEQAIRSQLGEAAIGIDVRVERGIVHLGGDVATEADFQAANYVARAVDGVIEVDQSQMRVVR